MPIYRGDGGSPGSTTETTLNAVTEKANEAAVSATNAANSADAAAASATTATTKAAAAATSATTASDAVTTTTANANSASTSASNASTSASNALSSANSASSSATSASNSATAAAASESAASDSETAAAASESAAAASESAAATSETNAATSASNAATSATNASTAQTAAETAQAAAEAAQAAIDAFYLGPLASNPTVDGNGDPVTAGDWYFNTSDNTTRIYNGSTWDTVSPDLVGDSTPQLGGTLDANGNTIDMGTNVITDTKVGQWDTAYGWGDHSTEGYLTSYTETDDLDDVTGRGATTTNAVTLGSLTVTKSATAGTQTANATGSTTLDFSTYQNFVLTLTGNVTLANPTTEAVGQSGFIVLIQDSTGGRTLSLGGDFETAGGSGLTISSAASTTDIVPYIVAASGRILLGAPQLAFA